MKYNPEKHHRRSIRLKDYDYSQQGAYFVTVCVHDDDVLLGDIIDGEMRLNDTGKMVDSIWNELPHHYPYVYTDAFVGMPNHIHGIILLNMVLNVGATPRGCPRSGDGSTVGQARGPAPTISLPAVVHRFKSLTTTRYRRNLMQYGRPLSPIKLWQRNYYEHIIRNEKSLNKIREYIINNPLRWQLDRNNPHRTGEDDFDRWLDTFKQPPKKT